MLHDVVVEDQGYGFGEIAGHGKKREVIGPKVEDETGELEGTFRRKEVEDGEQSQVAAGGLEIVRKGAFSNYIRAPARETYLSAHELQLCSKAGFRILYKPFGGIETVFRASRIRVLGCKSVPNRYHGHVRTVRNALQHEILAADPFSIR